MNPSPTPTPRTDAIQFQPKPISLSIENEMLRALSRQLERELAEKTNEASNWHQHYRDERDKAQKCKQAYIDKEKEVERLRKYVEKLEVYSPENEWSQPEWRKLVGSKEENEDPDTLFKLYQFRLAPAPEEPTIKESLTVEPVTEGTRIAAEARSVCNNLTDEKRKRLREKANEITNKQPMTPEELLKSMEHMFLPPSAMREFYALKAICLEREIARLHNVIRDEWPPDQAEEIINNCKK